MGFHPLVVDHASERLRLSRIQSSAQLGDSHDPASIASPNRFNGSRGPFLACVILKSPRQ